MYGGYLIRQTFLGNITTGIKFKAQELFCTGLLNLINEQKRKIQKKAEGKKFAIYLKERKNIRKTD